MRANLVVIAAVDGRLHLSVRQVVEDLDVEVVPA
jgi:hypothetical protein